MSQSIEKVLAERGARYGSFAENSKVAQDLKRIAQASPAWEKMRDPQKEAMEMILGKIGRILNGDPEYPDSWVDIGGYAKLAEKDVLSRPRRVAP